MRSMLSVLLLLAVVAPFPNFARELQSPRQAVIAAYAASDFEACARVFDAELGKRIWSEPNFELYAAKCYAVAGREDDAMRAIHRALMHPAFGPTHLQQIEKDEALMAMRSRVDWADSMRLATEKAATANFTGAGLDIAHARRHPLLLPFQPDMNRTWRATIVVWIEADGTPAEAEVEQSSGIRAFDRIAITTAVRWKYIPDVSDGTNYRSAVRLPFTIGGG